MTKTIYVVVAAMVVLVGCSRAQTASSVVQDAQSSIGMVTSIQYSGTGSNGLLGQALTVGQEWPLRDMSAYSKRINYDQQAACDEMMFTQPTFGGQQQTVCVRGDKAWNVGPNGPVPQLANAEDRQLQILLTPHGFLKAAAAATDATLTASEGANTITFTALGKYKLEGTVDGQNHVTRIKTTIGNPVLGDTEVVVNYGDYRAFGNVQFPGKIVVTQGGFPTTNLTITDVMPNATVDVAVPDAVASASVPPVQVTANKLADGVWHLTGGTHHSLVVEFNDYMAVVEAPVSEARAQAVFAEAKKLVPNKPIRYVLVTHHHFDHTGGLRAAVAEGATIITHQSNVAYFEKAATAPATVAPDAQAKSPKQPTFQGVSDKYVLTDGNQTIEVYATDGDTHTSEYALIYLPRQKILAEGDPFSPGPPDQPPPPMPPANALKLNEQIQRLKLDVATIAPIHGRGAVPIAEFRKFIGGKA